MDIATVKNGTVTIERHDPADSIAETLLENGLTFDDAESVLQLVRKKIGKFEMIKRPSGN